MAGNSLYFITLLMSLKEVILKENSRAFIVTVGWLSIYKN